MCFYCVKCEKYRNIDCILFWTTRLCVTSYLVMWGGSCCCWQKRWQKNLTSSSFWRIEKLLLTVSTLIQTSLPSAFVFFFSLQHITTASCCSTLIYILFTSASPRDHVPWSQGTDPTAPLLQFIKQSLIRNMSHVQMNQIKHCTSLGPKQHTSGSRLDVWQRQPALWSDVEITVLFSVISLGEIMLIPGFEGSCPPRYTPVVVRA